jgi:carbon storage regulator
MLILTRNIGESVQIGDHIAGTITDVHFRQVKIGITAPRDVAIVREELLSKDGDSASTEPPSSNIDAPF